MPTGNPHISYDDAIFGFLKYPRWDGSESRIEVVDGSGTMGGCVSPALDHADNPHICYTGGANGLRDTQWDGNLNQWVIQMIGVDGSVGLYTSLALDR